MELAIIFFLISKRGTPNRACIFPSLMTESDARLSVVHLAMTGGAVQQ